MELQGEKVFLSCPQPLNVLSVTSQNVEQIARTREEGRQNGHYPDSFGDIHQLFHLQDDWGQAPRLIHGGDVALQLALKHIQLVSHIHEHAELNDNEKVQADESQHSGSNHSAWELKTGVALVYPGLEPRLFFLLQGGPPQKLFDMLGLVMFQEGFFFL